jgi:co-chaperonin GroES (HSP10)
MTTDILPEEYYVVQDALLVEPAKESNDHETTSGILIPKVALIAQPGHPKVPEMIRGFVIRKGDGYPTHTEQDTLTDGRKTIHIPLKVNVGDEVYFMRGQQSLELTLLGKTYFLIKQSSVMIAKSNNFN